MPDLQSDVQSLALSICMLMIGLPLYIKDIVRISRIVRDGKISWYHGAFVGLYVVATMCAITSIMRILWTYSQEELETGIAQATPQFDIIIFCGIFIDLMILLSELLLRKRLMELKELLSIIQQIDQEEWNEKYNEITSKGDAESKIDDTEESAK